MRVMRVCAFMVCAFVHVILRVHVHVCVRMHICRRVCDEFVM